MRRGLTLIEMVVTISVAAVLTGLAISVLLVMYRVEQNGRTQLAQAKSLERLADQFRQDVHAAVGETVATEKEPQHWRFDLPEKRIVQYKIADGTISREDSTDAQNVRRESYTLPKDSTVAVSVDRTTNPAVVSLTIEPNQDSLRPHYPLRVDALQGRDLRFSERRKEGK
jgi:prepilin-type N-terminal cleavage/methylation domain-containing protein